MILNDFSEDSFKYHLLHPLEIRFRNDGISSVVDVSDELPLIWGVTNHIEQVFLNVLVNGWHAMPDGGTMTIQADVPNDRHVQITLRDTGIGMSTADLARVFEPFFSTKAEKGTGLGLAMCQQIIENHRGTIRLDSTPDAGTTVTVTLLQADAIRQV